MNRTGYRQSERNKIYAPIKSFRDIELLRQELDNNLRDLLLFDLATQTGIKMKHLLRLKVKHLHGVAVRQTLPLPEDANKAYGEVYMTETLFNTFKRYFEAFAPDQNDYLFKSRKGGKPLSLSSASTMIKGWYKKANLKGLSGFSSLRKTYEFFQQTDSFIKTIPYQETDPDPIGILEPIEAPTLQERVYTQLLQAIVSGRIPPGQRILIENVAKQLNVSPMPVREAFGRLVAVGIISSQKKRGNIVNELSRKDMEEILELRLMIESRAAEAACQRRTDELIRRLKLIHTQYTQSKIDNDCDEYLRLNKEFHHTIYRHANKSIFMQTINGLWDRYSPYLYILTREIVKDKYDTKLTIKFHQEIIDAMVSGDKRRVSKWLKADLNEGFTTLLKVFELVGANGGR